MAHFGNLCQFWVLFNRITDIYPRSTQARRGGIFLSNDHFQLSDGVINETRSIQP